ARPRFGKVTPAVVETLETLAALEDVVPRLRDARSLAVFPAIDPHETPDARLAGMAFATSSGEALYVPFELRYLGAPRPVKREDALRALAPVLADAHREK